MAGLAPWISLPDDDSQEGKMRKQLREWALSSYRNGVLQPLAMLAWRGWLPGDLSEGQVRAAMTAVIENMFGDSRNYNKKGFLTLGFNGSQPEISDYYTNNGSLYMASLAFLPLGLPADDPFWTSEAEDWTSKKSLGRQGFPERPFIQIGTSRRNDSEKTINFIRNFWLIGLIWIILQELS